MGRPWLQSVQHPLALILRRAAHIVLLFLVAGEDADFFDVCLEETLPFREENIVAHSNYFITFVTKNTKRQVSKCLHTLKDKQSIEFHLSCSVFYLPTGWMLEIAAPTLHTCKLIFMIHRILFNVCGRLFDELVKEWLLDRYIIVSGSFRDIGGRKVRVRRSHLRRKR